MQLGKQGELSAPARFHNAPGLLLAFVILSTLAHGLTLLFSADPVVVPLEQQFGSRVISTVLVTAEKVVMPTSNASTPPQQMPANRAARNVQPARLVTLDKTSKKTSANTVLADGTSHRTLGTTSTPTKIRTTSAPPAKTQTINESLAMQRKNQRNYLLGELQNRLSRYLTYPLRARRRGWQGEVRVAFHINEQGQLNHVRLARSSGYPLLDHSAVTAISKLKHIALPNTLGRPQAMELQLPVRYELREG